MTTYQSTKTFGHDLGLSVAFRQWRAESHCRFIHGYALSIKITFEATELDDKNWVVDFGSFKSLKETICYFFDHKLLVAHDDPQIDEICALAGIGVANVIVVNDCGCEKFAEMVYEKTSIWLTSQSLTPRCKVVSVEVSEHGANSAIYIG